MDWRFTPLMLACLACANCANNNGRDTATATGAPALIAPIPRGAAPMFDPGPEKDVAGMDALMASFGGARRVDGKPRAEKLSRDARELVDWITASRNHGRQPFAVVDKRNARLLVFDGSARLMGASPILLGAASGDHSVPGIGSRPIADIKPHERTTPAGRFQARHGRNLNGEDIIWVDYHAAVSMHRVRATVPAERRLERLASPTIKDNRISWGCINVPVRFFDAVVKRAFSGPSFTVYVLPETRSWRSVFVRPAGAPARTVAVSLPARPEGRGASDR